METVNNITSAASRAVFGTSPPHTSGEEPVSGELGDVKAGEPYDKGNVESAVEKTDQEPIAGEKGDVSKGEPFDKGNDAAAQPSTTSATGAVPGESTTSAVTASEPQTQASDSKIGTIADIKFDDAGAAGGSDTTTGVKTEGRDVTAVKPVDGLLGAQSTKETGLEPRLESSKIGDTDGTVEVKKDVKKEEVKKEEVKKEKLSLKDKIKAKLHKHKD